MKQPLKVVREHLGYTQAELSERIGIPINTIRNWEQEARKPSDWVLQLLLDKLLSLSYESNNPIDETTGILSFFTILHSVETIARKYDIKQVILFGSYASGQAREDSDVDVFIDSDLYGLEYFEFVEQLRTALRKKVDVFSYRTIEEGSTLDESIHRGGIVIYERS
jgi:predicted nucleotidyltransferase